MQRNPEPQQNPMLTAGKVLKARRKELGKSIGQISQETKIQTKYISLLENDDYEALDSDVFASGFIKIYAANLGLDVDRVLAIYRRSSPKVKVKQSVNSKKQPLDAKEIFAKFATPRNSIVLVLILIVIGLLGYLSFQFYNFQKEPYLNVESPANNQTTDKNSVVVKGETEQNTFVEINGKIVNLDDESRFEETISLNEGNNVIAVRAVKENNQGRETVKQINIKYEIPVIITPDPVEPEVPTINTFRFDIVDEAAWIRVDIDGVQEFAQVLNVGFTEEFEVLESAFISTGKPASTKVYINGQEVALTINSDLGTASLACEIDDGKLLCE